MHTPARVKAWHEAARELRGNSLLLLYFKQHFCAHAQDYMSGLLLTQGDSKGVL